MKTVNDILSMKGNEVWSINPEATVYEALQFMCEKEIGALLVIDEQGKVAGIISERDYARKIILAGKSSRETPVKDIMTGASEMFSVKPKMRIEDCMVLMTGKRIRHLPVFDGDKLVGMISSGDVIKSIISQQELLIEQLSNYIAGKI